jgi:DNA-binding CsgD family transcriptional regulator
VDYFDFIATDTDDFALNRFLNNIELLEHFINFFYDKADSILKASAKQKLIYPREPLLQSANDQQIAIDKAVFFNETAINRFMFVNSLGMQQAMSRREIECAHYLLLGATAKQVASELSLSPRTIETYIESLKTKTETSSKSQLIQFLSKLQLPAHYKKCG